MKEDWGNRLLAEGERSEGLEKAACKAIKNGRRSLANVLFMGSDRAALLYYGFQHLRRCGAKVRLRLIDDPYSGDQHFS